MNSYIDALLLKICEKLQLQPSLYEQANERYQIISEKIQMDTAFKNIELKMYPQGSFRLKTTVKPLQQNEYDLDFVVELPQNTVMTPKQLYDHIYRILIHDGIHNNMVEPKTRCIRVNYMNDFHMDIMPGKLINETTKEIIVPDRELKSWYHHSNPIGYAEWFENQAKTQIVSEICKARGFQAKAEPIADQELTKRLEPLRRAVQLIKRYRDIYCSNNKTEPVRSIVVCTLMGYISSSYSDTLDIIYDFCKYVKLKINETNGAPFEVRNPVVNEVLTEKWIENPQNYRDFVAMMEALNEDILKLKITTINNDIVTLLKKMFGESITNEAVMSYAKDTGIDTARKTGMLAVGSTGILNTNGSGTKVVKNTFYGE